MGVGDCSRIITMKIDRQKILNKYGKRCGYCGTDIDLKSMQVDHIIPQENFEDCIRNIMHIPKFLLHLTLRDVHNIDNLMPACRSCNNWKHSMSLEFFRHELELQVKRLRERSSNYRIALRYGFITENPKKLKFYFETLVPNSTEGLK